MTSDSKTMGVFDKLYWSTDFRVPLRNTQLPSNEDVMMAPCPVPQPHFTESIYTFPTPCPAAEGSRRDLSVESAEKTLRRGMRIMKTMIQ